MSAQVSGQPLETACVATLIEHFQRIFTHRGQEWIPLRKVLDARLILSGAILGQIIDIAKWDEAGDPQLQNYLSMLQLGQSIPLKTKQGGFDMMEEIMRIGICSLDDFERKRASQMIHDWHLLNLLYSMARGGGTNKCGGFSY